MGGQENLVTEKLEKDPTHRDFSCLFSEHRRTNHYVVAQTGMW